MVILASTASARDLQNSTDHSIPAITVVDADTQATMHTVSLVQADTAHGVADSDGDGIADDQDNCIEVANPEQRDTDQDNIGNACDADIAEPNDCSINFLDLNEMKVAFFSDPASPNWNEDADLDGDGAVNFSDLQAVKESFFGTPGPSGPGNICRPLGPGDVCDPNANFCAEDLACCYPCGIPGCNNMCVVPCDPTNPLCAGGCIIVP